MCVAAVPTPSGAASHVLGLALPLLSSRRVVTVSDRVPSAILTRLIHPLSAPLSLPVHAVEVAAAAAARSHATGPLAPASVAVPEVSTEPPSGEVAVRPPLSAGLASSTTPSGPAGALPPAVPTPAGGSLLAAGGPLRELSGTQPGTAPPGLAATPSVAVVVSSANADDDDDMAFPELVAAPPDQ